MHALSLFEIESWTEEQRAELAALRSAAPAPAPSSIGEELRARLAQLEEELDRERQTFPADGVWLVRTYDGGREARLIDFLADVPEPVELAAIARHEEAIAAALEAVRESARATLVLDPPSARARWTYPAARTVAREIVSALHRALLAERAPRPPSRYPVLSAEDAEAEQRRREGGRDG